MSDLVLPQPENVPGCTGTVWQGESSSCVFMVSRSAGLDKLRKGRTSRYLCIAQPSSLEGHRVALNRLKKEDLHERSICAQPLEHSTCIQATTVRTIMFIGQQKEKAGDREPAHIL